MITPRLEAVKRHITKQYAADIGTDHAYIPIALIKENVCKKIIATDLKKGPLEIAENNIKKYGFSDRIETRLGDGLSPLKENEAQQIIIAGMGGFLISKILENGKKTANRSELILQPMNCQYELRKYLISNGYKIINEDLALEGFKIYNIITAAKGEQSEYKNELYYHLPPELFLHPLFSYIKAKKEREFMRIIDGQKKSAVPDILTIEKYKSLLSELKKI